MTRPKSRPSIRYRIAFAASSSGNVLDTMGTIRPELRSSVIVFHASDRADKGWENSRKLLILPPFQIRLVTSMVVFLLAAYPNVVRLPSGARISSPIYTRLTDVTPPGGRPDDLGTGGRPATTIRIDSV